MKAKLTIEGEIHADIRFRVSKRNESSNLDFRLDYAPTDREIEQQAELLWNMLKGAMPWRLRDRLKHIVVAEHNAEYAGMPEEEEKPRRIIRPDDASILWTHAPGKGISDGNTKG